MTSNPRFGLLALTVGLLCTLFMTSCRDEAKPPPHPGLLDPALAQETAPAQFQVRLETTQGEIVVEVTRDWAPHGTDRFYNLIRIGYFEDIGMIRVKENFMGQFGHHGTPMIARAWNHARIPDDPRSQSNVKGTLTFAQRPEPHSRTTQLFLNFEDNTDLDRKGFVPIGKIVRGLGILDKIHRTGEGAPGGPGPSQVRLGILGNDYLRESYPDLDYIVRAEIISERS